MGSLNRRSIVSSHAVVVSFLLQVFGGLRQDDD